MSRIEKVGVVGAGLMGLGIVEVSARAGLNVVLVEANEAVAQTAASRVELSLKRAHACGKVEDIEGVMARVAVAGSLDLLADRDIVIEAIVEDAAAKTRLFDQLDRIVESRHAILASNTSSIPLMRLGAATSRPEQVMGIHFFNPVPVLPLVELVPSLLTSRDTLERARSWVAETLSKEPIESQDRAGFVVNALLVPFLLAAVRMYESGFAAAADIDRGLVLHGEGSGRVAVRRVQGAALRESTAAGTHG